MDACTLYVAHQAKEAMFYDISIHWENSWKNCMLTCGNVLFFWLTWGHISKFNATLDRTIELIMNFQRATREKIAKFMPSHDHRVHDMYTGILFQLDELYDYCISECKKGTMMG